MKRRRQSERRDCKLDALLADVASLGSGGGGVDIVDGSVGDMRIKI